MKKNYATSLVDLLRGYCDIPAALNTHLSGIAIDSRKVKKGDLFISTATNKGEIEGHICEALQHGANAILRDGSERCGVHEDGNAVEVSMGGLSSCLGEIVSKFYREPSQDLSVIGVTGTNGKTSVANYLASYLSTSEQKCGVMGTLGFGLVGEDIVETGYTTPDIVEVHKNLALMRDAGAKVIVMEVSSHGLCQGRVDAVSFFGAVFTNLTREHLDYHGSMDDYAKAKQSLFKSKGLRFAVLNRDDEYFSAFKAAIASDVDIRTYGVKNHSADISVLTKKYSASGIRALIKAPIGQVNLDSALLGEFNLCNLLAVIATATAMNDLSELESRIARIQAVPGRMEVVKRPLKPSVVIDYAHTPDALENVLKSLRPLCDGNLKVVFGCGGDRDQGKRPIMAKITAALADEIIVTDDNPRGEPSDAIISDIMAGFEDDSKVDVIKDRRLAIGRALEGAKESDLILVAGKGHEAWQEVKGSRHYFSDIETVRELMINPQVSEVDAREALYD